MLNDPERFMIRALTIGVVLCAMARAATAQDATLQVGGRARVRTMLLNKWSYGRVISVDSGGVLLDPCAACEGSEIPGATIGAYLAYRDVQRRGGRVGLATRTCLLARVRAPQRRQNCMAVSWVPWQGRPSAPSSGASAGSRSIPARTEYSFVIVLLVLLIGHLLHPVDRFSVE